MKKILSLILSLIICISITACGNTAKEIDINALSGELLNAQIFDEELTQVKTSVTIKRLGLNEADIEECVAYAGTKAVVDEIVLIKAVEGAYGDVQAALNKHVDTQIKSYTSYRPEEVPKLEEALSLSFGNYVMLIVSNNSEKAQEIVDKSTK